MPYRQKVAWLSLLAMAVVFTPYFTWAKLHPPTNVVPNLPRMALYAATAGVWVLILGIGHAVLRWRAPGEAKLPLDERDRAIQYRSRNYAYGVLLTGMILVGCIMPFTGAGWEIVNAAIFMIVLAEIVHDGTVVCIYHKQQG
jgi:hypothetical protein